MAICYSSAFTNTPQTEKIPGSDQVANNGGGFGWKIDKWDLFNRFLILGSEKGTYYVKERALTVANAENAIACIKEDGTRALRMCLEISHLGKAPKNDPAIFVLALCCTFGDQDTKERSYRHIAKVCRIGTHLFTFMQNIKDLRKWSRGLRKGVAEWYLGKDHDELEYQLLKYKQRNGWSHKDVLRLCHVKPRHSHNLYYYAVHGKIEDGTVPSERMQILEIIHKDLQLIWDLSQISKYKITREMLPTQFLNHPEIWAELLKGMPMHALIRNLAKMTAVGLLKSNLDDEVIKICEKLRNEEAIKKSRLHPIAILNALRVYSQGRGDKGSLTWTPVEAIVTALNDAFRLAFINVEPTKKKIMIGLDVSGSMYGNSIAGTNLDAATAACALALITAETEPYHEITVFSDKLLKINMPPKTQLDALIRTMKGVPFGATDCALPILDAMNRSVPVDCFIIYTDSETNCNSMHPAQALKLYRQKMGIQAKLIVVAMCSNDFTIADPNDKDMLDICGFSTDVPALIREFILQ